MEGRLSDKDNFRATVWFCEAMQVAVGNRLEGAFFLEHPISQRKEHPRKQRFLAESRRITGDFDFKDHNDRNHFLDRTSTASKYLDKKKQESAAK